MISRISRIFSDMNTEQSPLRAEAVERLKTDLCAGCEPQGARVIYAGRNRLYTVALPDGTVACVKDFKRAGLLKGIIYGFFRDSKAHRSFDNARRLLDMGFDTPAPLGWCETHKRLGLLDRAYYICEFRPDVAETRCWEEWPDRDAFVDALGREMARLFRAGVLFEDFSPGNVMYRREADGNYRFCYVDVNRTRFGRHGRRKLMTMFRRINIVEAETGRLARATARALDENPDRMERRALRVLRRFLFSKDRVQKPLKRFFRRLILPFA